MSRINIYAMKSTDEEWMWYRHCMICGAETSAPCKSLRTGGFREEPHFYRERMPYMTRREMEEELIRDVVRVWTA